MTAPAIKGNARLRNFLYYSTLIYVFSALLIVRLGLSIRPLEVGLLLMCLVVSITHISGWILWFLLYLFVSGVLGIAHGTDSFSLFFVQFRAISINLLYYYFFFKMIRNDFERAFFTYTRIAYWFAIIALPLWAGSCIAAHDYVRLAGLATEPAAFCILIVPAYYWYAYQLVTTHKHAAEVAIFTLAVVLSGSSLGVLSVAFGAFLLLSGRRRHFLAAPLVVCALLGIMYASSSLFRLRVDDTLVAATTLDLTGSNLSTYALISNALVTQQVLEESPLIGNGLGSYPMSHERFLYNIQGIEFFIEQNLENTDELTASSITLRILSELGILGYLGVLVFLFHFHVGGIGLARGHQQRDTGMLLPRADSGRRLLCAGAIIFYLYLYSELSASEKRRVDSCQPFQLVLEISDSKDARSGTRYKLNEGNSDKQFLHIQPSDDYNNDCCVYPTYRTIPFTSR